MPEMDGGDVSAALYGNPETVDIPVLFLTSLVTAQESNLIGEQIAGRPAISKHAPTAALLAKIELMLQR